MPINFDKAFGIHPQALALRARRTEVLAANLANADTPGYKAQDIDFKTALSRVSSQSSTLKTTHSGHLQANQSVMGERLMYRIPLQPSLDGNTVDSQVEQAKFAENALQYQANLQFMTGKITGLRSAIRGD
jgi:flagellar basal-body rod protein FlgB